jgi:hypothetical protein
VDAELALNAKSPRDTTDAIELYIRDQRLILIMEQVVAFRGGGVVSEKIF